MRPHMFVHPIGCGDGLYRHHNLDIFPALPRPFGRYEAARPVKPYVPNGNIDVDSLINDKFILIENQLNRLEVKINAIMGHLDIEYNEDTTVDNNGNTVDSEGQNIPHEETIYG